jgi:putative membrane protein
MIRNFSDHAANERTYLAWVRTAIAVMAFGFLVERFDLILRMMPASVPVHVASPHHLRLGALAGLALMMAGLAIVVVATARFLRAGREIDDDQPHAGAGSRLDLALSAMLLLLGCALFGYLAVNIYNLR